MATPGPPIPFSDPVPIAAGALRFLWTAPLPPPTTYELSVFSTEGEREYRLHAAALQFLLPGNAMYYDVSGLTVGTLYTGGIKASSDGGATWGPEAPFAAASPLAAPPAPVRHATAFRTDATSATVVWATPTIAPTPPATAYFYVETASSNPADEVLANTTADLSTFTAALTGLNPTSVYSVAVYVKNAVGQSPPFYTNKF